MESSYSRSLIHLSRPPSENTFDNNKVDQLYSLLAKNHWILWIILVSWSLHSAAQTPYSKKLEASSKEFEISVAELKVPGKAWSHLQAAHKDLSEGKLKEATKEADRALQIAPKCAPAFSMKAFIDLAGRNPLAAVQDATRATSIDPYSAESFVALAMAYNSVADFLNGQHAAQEALTIRPESWQARLELAKSLYGQGGFDAALGELNAIRKNFPDVHLVKGNVLMCLGRTHESVAEFALFLDEAPHDHRAEAIRQIIARAETSPPS